MLLIFLSFFFISSASGMDDPLRVELDSFKHSIIRLSSLSTDAIIKNLKIIIQANNNRSLSCLEIEQKPLSMQELAQEYPVKDFLEIILNRINKEISQTKFEEIKKTEIKINEILEQLSDQFREIIYCKLRKHWSNEYSPSCLGLYFYGRLSYYPTENQIPTILFDSIQEIIYFNQLIKNASNLTNLIKVNSLNFGRFAYYKDIIIKQSVLTLLRYFPAVISQNNLTNSLMDYRAICNDQSFDFIEQQEMERFKNQSLAAFQDVLIKQSYTQLAEHYKTVQESDSISTPINQMISELIEAKINQEISGEYTQKSIDELINFMNANKRLPNTIFSTLRKLLLQKKELGLKSLVTSRVQCILENNIDKDTVTEIASHFKALLKESLNVNSLEELHTNLEQLKQDKIKTTLEVSLPEFKVYIDLFEGFLHKGQENTFCSIPKNSTTDRIMSEIWSEISKRRVARMLFFSAYYYLISDNINELHATLHKLNYPFLASDIRYFNILFYTEKFNNKKISDIFNFATNNLKNSLIGLSYLNALKINTKSALLACCRNKKVENKKDDSSPEIITDELVIPTIILNTMQQHINEDISEKNKGDSFKRLCAIAQNGQELQSTNPELYEYFKPTLENAVKTITRNKPHYSKVALEFKKLPRDI